MQFWHGTWTWQVTYKKQITDNLDLESNWIMALKARLVRSTKQKNTCEKARKMHGCNIFVRICTATFTCTKFEYLIFSTRKDMVPCRQTIKLKPFWMDFVLHRKNAKNGFDCASLSFWNSNYFKIFLRKHRSGSCAHFLLRHWEIVGPTCW